MGVKIDAQMPEGVVVGDGWQIVLDAVDPTTGDSVAGVVVSNVSVVADEQAGSAVVDNPILVGIAV